MILLASRLSAAEITVYTYDSFASKGGLGPVVKEQFEKKYGAKVNLRKFPSAGEALNQVSLDALTKGRQSADVVVGIDDGRLGKALALKAFAPLDKSLVAQVPEDLQLDKTHTILPFDYGFLAFVYDAKRTTPPKGPLTLFDFLNRSELRKKIVIEDFRTSSIGLSFLIWVRRLSSGADWSKIWPTIGAQAFALTPGWSTAYDLFLRGEVDYALSYTTSPAYHIEHDSKHDVRALPFSNGHYRQIEGMGILKSSKQPKLARQFVELMLSAEVQAKIPQTNWMYPVAKGVALPPSFQNLPKVEKVLQMDPAEIETSKEAWIREATALLAGKG